eukprot:SAG25_NODE_384_length_8785_cov_7.011628_7_plen_54_part_00
MFPKWIGLTAAILTLEVLDAGVGIVVIASAAHSLDSANGRHNLHNNHAWSQQS